MTIPGSPRLILVRHGQTDHNKSRRVQGHIDIPLNAEGLQQAHKLALHLKALGVTAPHIHTSDLSRAYATAHALHQALGGTLETFAELREILMGNWEGQLYDELAATDPVHPLFWSGDPRARPPGGETAEEVTERVWQHLQLYWPHAGKTLVLVSHGITLGALLTRLLGGDYRQDFEARRYMHANTGYSVLDVTPDRKVLRAEVVQAGHLG